MSTVQSYTPKALTVTDSAAHKIATLMLEENNLSLKLRVYIEGGGCSGLQYGFTFEEEVTPEDFVISKTVSLPGEEIHHIELLVDSISYQYLMGAEIDYESNIHGEQFIIRNPNAATTCGCGSSFSVKEGGGGEA